MYVRMNPIIRKFLKIYMSRRINSAGYIVENPYEDRFIHSDLYLHYLYLLYYLARRKYEIDGLKRVVIHRRQSGLPQGFTDTKEEVILDLVDDPYIHFNNSLTISHELMHIWLKQNGYDTYAIHSVDVTNAEYRRSRVPYRDALSSIHKVTLGWYEFPYFDINKVVRLIEKYRLV